MHLVQCTTQNAGAISVRLCVGRRFLPICGCHVPKRGSPKTPCSEGQCGSSSGGKEVTHDPKTAQYCPKPLDLVTGIDFGSFGKFAFLLALLNLWGPPTNCQVTKIDRFGRVCVQADSQTRTSDLPPHFSWMNVSFHRHAPSLLLTRTFLLTKVTASRRYNGGLNPRWALWTVFRPIVVAANGAARKHPVLKATVRARVGAKRSPDTQRLPKSAQNHLIW